MRQKPHRGDCIERKACRAWQSTHIIHDFPVLYIRKMRRNFRNIRKNINKRGIKFGKAKWGTQKKLQKKVDNGKNGCYSISQETAKTLPGEEDSQECIWLFFCFSAENSIAGQRKNDGRVYTSFLNRLRSRSL